MSLAIFDLDETLIAGDSCSLFCEFMVAEGIASAGFLQQDALMMERYDAQTLVLSDYIRFFMAPLRPLSISDIDALMPRFVEQYIVPRIYPEAIKLLADYKKKGVRLLIISATCEFIVKAVAKKLGVTDVLAIQLKTQNNYYCSEVSGVATFREGKVTRLQSWLVEQQESIDGAAFYSDSINDLLLLELIKNPVATNPDNKLLVIAVQRNWPVLLWNAPKMKDALPSLSSLLIQQDSNHV